MGSTPIRRARIYWAVGLGLMGFYALLRDSDWLGTPTLHTLMESVATMLAITVGAMALVRYYTLKETIFLFIGAGFLGTAFLDGYHTIVTAPYFRAFMPSDLPQLIPWSWISSRVFLSIFLALSWVSWLWEARVGRSRRFNEVVVFGFTAVFTVVSFLFFTFAPLPDAYFCEVLPNGGLSCPWVFGRPEEFVPAFFLAVALIGYLRKGRWRTEAFEHWLIVSLIVGLVGEAVVMSFATQNFDFEFDLAHMLKKVSYVCVLTGLLVSMSDIFRKEHATAEALNDALLRTQKARRELERSNQDLDAFAYIASHDLKEPLRGIHNYSLFLMEDYGDKLDDAGRDKLETLVRLTQRMDALISTLLRYSRLGRVELTITNSEIGGLVRQAVEALRVAIHDSHADVTTAKNFPTVLCDPVLTVQIFQNLLANAIKYGDPDEPRVEIGWDNPSGEAVFFVRDNGIGIREKDQDSIFQIFKRLHGKNEYGGGIGAGLTISSKIAERHGGRLWVVSEFGEGSTFFFTLGTESDV